MDEIKKQKEDAKKQNDEMRKLKAIIVKHENRIRALEAAQKARDEDVLDTILSAPDKDLSPAPLQKVLSDNDMVPSAALTLASDEV